jgi:transposase
VRPVFVRTEANTRGHVLVVMLSYLIIRALKRAWKDIDLTVEESIKELDRICAMQLSVKGGECCLRIPEPSAVAKELLNALDVNLPLMLPKSMANVDTKKKLSSRRKN